MEERARTEDENWGSVMESLDLLFAKVGIVVVEDRQQRMETQFDISTKLLEQMLLDQQTLAKQMESTGNAVAQLTLNQMRARHDRPPSPASNDSNEDVGFQHRRQHAPGGSGQGRTGVPPHRAPHRDRPPHTDHHGSRPFLPKM